MDLIGRTPLAAASRRADVMYSLAFARTRFIQTNPNQQPNPTTMKRFILLILAVIFGTVPLAQAQRMPVTTTSDEARVQYVAGVNALANADFARARTHLDAALTADPSFAMAHMYRAVTSPSGRDEHMRQATTHGSRASDAERQMIASYAAHLDGDHEREIDLMNGVAEAFPSDPYPPFQVGFELYGLERYTEAIAAFRRALTIAPNFGGAYNGLGYAAMEAGDDAVAEQAFRDYIRAAPDEANPYDSYGEFLMLAGRLDEAEGQFEMALMKDPTFEVSRTNLARIGIERSNRRFEQGVASGNAEAIASIYTANAIIMPPDSPPLRGRAAIRDYMTNLIGSGNLSVDIETVEVNRFDDVAVERSNLTISAGGEIVDRGKALVIWQLVDGEWLYARDMWSSNGSEVSGTH